MDKKINFNAGPAELPGEVLYDVARATQKYKKTGLSLLELPHRGPDFLEIIEESKQLVCELCNIDDNYEILWLHGGGRMQFCMAPMNFLGEGQTAAYIDSGHWAKEAINYARYYGDARVIASSEEQNYRTLPEWPTRISPKPVYIHITTNNTVTGTQWNSFPHTTAPLIADMSSDILSGKRDYSRFAMFYATAQKNLGVPGLALVVIRKDMLKKSARPVPPLFSYKEQVRENSLVNTANIPAVYTSLLMLRWIKERSLERIEQENIKKAELLYETLDNSRIFSARVTEKAHRSMMNVCFDAITNEHEKKFLQLCDDNNIAGIKGHRSTGGFRASLYNVVPYDSVVQLVSLMNEYEHMAQ